MLLKSWKTSPLSPMFYSSPASPNSKALACSSQIAAGGMRNVRLNQYKREKKEQQQPPPPTRASFFLCFHHFFCGRDFFRIFLSDAFLAAIALLIKITPRSASPIDSSSTLPWFAAAADAFHLFSPVSLDVKVDGEKHDEETFLAKQFFFFPSLEGELVQFFS